MFQDNHFSTEAILENTHIGNHIKIYKGAEVRNSLLGDFVTVGDTSIINKSKIGSNSAINRRNYVLRSNIGSYTYTGLGTMILSSNIGKFCSIGWNVSIGGDNHDYTKVTTSPLWRFQVLDKGNTNYSIDYSKQSHCNIGNDVWIASNVVILRDVKIGDGAVIGAGSVVTKDVEPYSIVAGVPAKKLKMRFNNDTVKILRKIEWWNWPREVIRSNLELIYSSTVDQSVLCKLISIYNSINED